MQNIIDECLVLNYYNGLKIFLKIRKDRILRHIFEFCKDLIANKKSVFKCQQFVLCKPEDARDSLKNIRDIYFNTYYPLLKPKIWGKQRPAFFDEMYLFRYEALKKEEPKSKNVRIVYRRKSMDIFKDINLKEILMQRSSIQQVEKVGGDAGKEDELQKSKPIVNKSDIIKVNSGSDKAITETLKVHPGEDVPEPNVRVHLSQSVAINSQIDKPIDKLDKGSLLADEAKHDEPVEVNAQKQVPKEDQAQFEEEPKASLDSEPLADKLIPSVHLNMGGQPFKILSMQTEKTSKPALEVSEAEQQKLSRSK